MDWLVKDEAAKQLRLARNPTGRFGKPEEIVNMAMYLASDESRWTNGANARHRRRHQRQLLLTSGSAGALQNGRMTRKRRPRCSARREDDHRRRAGGRRRRPDLRGDQPGHRPGHRHRAPGRHRRTWTGRSRPASRRSRARRLATWSGRQARPDAGQVREPGQGERRGAGPARVGNVGKPITGARWRGVAVGLVFEYYAGAANKHLRRDDPGRAARPRLHAARADRGRSGSSCPGTSR